MSVAKKPASKARSAMRIAKRHASRARLHPFTRGVIWGMHIGKVQREEMLKHVQKKDGSPLLLDTLDYTIAKKKAEPKWLGEDSSAGGRTQELSDAEQKALLDLLFKERGRCKVTVAYCKKRLACLRRVNDTTVTRALHRAGLRWLQRRMKTNYPR